MATIQKMQCFMYTLCFMGYAVLRRVRINGPWYFKGNYLVAPDFFAEGASVSPLKASKDSNAVCDRAWRVEGPGTSDRVWKVIDLKALGEEIGDEIALADARKSYDAGEVGDGRLSALRTAYAIVYGVNGFTMCLLGRRWLAFHYAFVHGVVLRMKALEDSGPSVPHIVHEGKLLPLCEAMKENAGFHVVVADLVELAKALQKLHSAGVVHCDVRLENIVFVDRSGSDYDEAAHAQLIDVDMARPIGCDYDEGYNWDLPARPEKSIGALASHDWHALRFIFSALIEVEGVCKGDKDTWRQNLAKLNDLASGSKENWE